MGFGGINGGQGGQGGIGGGLGNKKVVPTFGVSFGLPYPSGAYGGYPINPFGGNPIPNPHFGAISPNGLNLGLVNVNPLVSFQVSKNEYGEKLLKPLVNLHVTPNENIIQKVGNLFHAKKHGIQQSLNNVNYHHHTHQNYPPPPSIYHPHHYEEPHHYPHHHEGPHHHGGGGPEFYPSGPSGGGGGGGGYGFAQSGYGFPQSGHGGSGYYRDAASSSGGEYESPSGGGGGGVELDYNPNEHYSRSVNVTNNPNQYNQYQSYYPEQNFNQNQEQSNYQNNYANNYNYADNQNQNQNYQNQNQNQNQNYAIHAIPTPAPGDSRGAKHVSFPNNRRKRDVDQSEIIESEDKKEIESEERSLSIEKVMYIKRGLST